MQAERPAAADRSAAPESSPVEAPSRVAASPAETRTPPAREAFSGNGGMDEEFAEPSTADLMGAGARSAPVVPGSPAPTVSASASPLPADISRRQAPPAAPPVSLPPMAEMKEQIIGALRKVRHSLGATMEKAASWDLSGSDLNLVFNSSFEASFLEKERSEIERIILESLGWTLHLHTSIHRREEAAAEQKVEEQVELVRQVFRGTIVK